MATWLKAKYRKPGRLLHRQFDPPEGTWVYDSESHPAKQRTNSATAKRTSLRPGRRAYGPW